MVRLHGSGPVLSLFASFVLLAPPSARALAADIEQRDFSIMVNGKEAGRSRYTITVQDDGITVVASTAQVKINQLILNFTFTMEATEWWKDGKLAGLKANSVENGKRTELVVAVDGNRLKVRVNGQERLGSPEAWTTSFWKLADPRYHNKAVPVLDAETGKEYTGQLQFVGTEQLTFLNQPQNCYHFRVTGGSYPVELWFDRYHRLVRQEFTESGHKTIVQLTALKR